MTVLSSIFPVTHTADQLVVVFPYLMHSTHAQSLKTIWIRHASRLQSHILSGVIEKIVIEV